MARRPSPGRRRVCSPVICTPLPPSLWYIQSCPARVAITYWPSADQMGDEKLIRSLFVMTCGLRAVGVGDPDVLRAVAVAHEDDLRSVGRVARLLIPAHAARDARGFAAGDRDRIQVAEDVEDDRLPIGRDVERDPRRFVGRELERPRGDERKRVRAHRGLRRAVVLRGGLRRGPCCGERGEGEPGCDDEPTVTHGRSPGMDARLRAIRECRGRTACSNGSAVGSATAPGGIRRYFGERCRQEGQSVSGSDRNTDAQRTENDPFSTKPR